MHFAFLSLTCIALLLAGGSHAEQLGTRNYDIARLGPILADPLIQHGKETYVLAGCANCHGVNLEPSGEAADLMHSPLVGLDKNGDAIGPVLRAGIPQTMSMSPMPQYSDLSEQQITAIARWIHYARQLGRYQELMPTTDPRGGDAVAGKRVSNRGAAVVTPCSATSPALDAPLTAKRCVPRFFEPDELKGGASFRLDELRDSKAGSSPTAPHAVGARTLLPMSPILWRI